MIFSKLPPAPLGAGFFLRKRAQKVSNGANVIALTGVDAFLHGHYPAFLCEQGRARARYLTKAQAVTAPTSEAMSATGTA